MVVGAFILIWIQSGQRDCVTKLLVIPAIIGGVLYCAWGIFGAIVLLLGVFCGMASSDSLVPLSILVTVVVVAVIIACSLRQQ